MPKTVYLHMGFMKTASTSFQTTCSENIQNLKNQGYIYPLFECIEIKNKKNIRNHSIPFVNCFIENPQTYHSNIKLGIEDINKVNKAYLKQIEDVLLTNSKVIISAEGLSNVSEDALNKLVDYFNSFDFEVVPIVLVRSPYSFFCSVVAENIKTGRYMDFKKFLGQQKNIIKMKKVFGDKINFFSFNEACSHGEGPVGFLLEFMRVNIDEITSKRSNVSFDNIFVRTQNILNKYEPRIVNGKLNTQYISLETLSSNKNKKFYLTEKEYSVIKNRHQIENDFYKNELGEKFCDTDLFFSEDVYFNEIIESYPEILKVFS